MAEAVTLTVHPRFLRVCNIEQPATGLEAKFSFRLVPDQDPQQITASLRSFLEPLVPAGIQMELIDMHSAIGVSSRLISMRFTAIASAWPRSSASMPG